MGMKARVWTVPNQITLLRLGFLPIFLILISYERYKWALLVLVVAGLSDAIDGLLARSLNQKSSLGAYLDPIADKCLLSGVFLALAGAGLAPLWFVAVIFGRDFYILAAVAILLLLTPSRRFPPSVWGKVSTFVQVATATLWLAAGATAYSLLDSVSHAMLWPCAVFTAWSGVHYTWRGLQLARAH
jgi:cardiolipin synthase (CMP-forming)